MARTRQRAIECPRCANPLSVAALNPQHTWCSLCAVEFTAQGNELPGVVPPEPAPVADDPQLDVPRPSTLKVVSADPNIAPPDLPVSAPPRNLPLTEVPQSQELAHNYAAAHAGWRPKGLRIRIANDGGEMQFTATPPISFTVNGSTVFIE